MSGETQPTATSMAKCLQSLLDSDFQQISDLCDHYLKHRFISKKSYLTLRQSVVSTHRLDAHSLDAVLSSALHLVIECQSGHKTMNSELNQKHKIDSKSAAILMNKVLGQTYVDRSLTRVGNLALRLRSLRWRIDVCISNQMLSRIMEPSIVFEFVVIVNNSINRKEYLEKVIVFECKTSEFHRLRLNVAKLVKQMTAIGGHWKPLLICHAFPV